MRIIFQHAKNFGKARSFHPTRQHQTQKYELIHDMFYLKLGTDPVDLMQDKETYNSPDMSKCLLKFSTPRLPEVVDFARSNIADIDWNMRILIDPSPVDPKYKTQPKLCEDAGATLE